MTAKVKKVKVKKDRKFLKAVRSFFVRIAHIKFIGAPLRWMAALGRYFRDSWRELKLVRWPNRKATWGLVLAVLGFSGFLVVLILLLDIAFKELFQLIIK